MFCGSSGVIRGRCEFCGYGFDRDHPGAVQNGTVIYRPDYHIQSITNIHKDTFACATDDQICQACYDENTRTFSTADSQDVVNSNMDAMRWFDWVTVFLTTFVIGLSVAAEIRDIRLCWISIGTAQGEGGSIMGRRWVSALRLLQLLRQYAFLQYVLLSVPAMVAWRGSDSLSVCFNTLAILFIMQLDNDFYACALAEQTRAEVEEHGRVEMDTTSAAGRRELQLLALTKNVHIALIMATVPTITWLMKRTHVALFFFHGLCGCGIGWGC